MSVNAAISLCISQSMLVVYGSGQICFSALKNLVNLVYFFGSDEVSLTPVQAAVQGAIKQARGRLGRLANSSQVPGRSHGLVNMCHC